MLNTKHLKHITVQTHDLLFNYDQISNSLSEKKKLDR